MGPAGLSMKTRSTIKEKWLALENWVVIHRGVIAIILFILFFFVFPFFVLENIDFDAITSTIP